MVYRASAPTQTIEVPKRCLAIHSLGSEWLCEQTDQLSRLAPNETVMEMENKHLIQPADSQVAVWQRGQIHLLEGLRQKAYPLSVRHRVSVIHLGSDDSELILGTTTGSVLRWQPEHSEWMELATFPDKVVSLDLSDSEVLVALEDEPFSILQESVSPVGREVASAVATNGQRSAIAARFGGLSILHDRMHCTDALGVEQVLWLGDDLLAWGGLTSGVWRLGTPCRRIGILGQQLVWLDTQQPVQLNGLSR